MTRDRFRWVLSPIMIVLLALLALLTLGGALAAQVLERAGITPRQLAPYIEGRTSGHNPTIVAAGQWVGRTLMTNDRGPATPPQALRLKVGAQSGPAAPAREPGPAAGASRRVAVASAATALAAMMAAMPGDVIEFAPGRYRLGAPYIELTRPGTAQQPITVRALAAGSVVLELDTAEGFLIGAPYWRFENLMIVGACPQAADCAHAFHIVGKGAHFIARNNTITDFNAHFKINGSGKAMPDGGLLEHNTLRNASIRPTDTAVTPIDLVAASDWIIRKNFIADFFKRDGDQTSYGAFAKGGGSNNLFENNIVLCEYLLRSPTGARVGLSLGGGGTGTSYCRDGACRQEQSGSILRANLVASCSDDGIYLNRAAGSQVVHNTVVDTAGVSIRFPESDARVEGNLIDGVIRRRDSATVHDIDNIDTAMLRLFLGSHPVRHMLEGANPASFRGMPPRREKASAGGAPVPDLCDAPARSAHAYGAFDDFAACLK